MKTNKLLDYLVKIILIVVIAFLVVTILNSCETENTRQQLRKECSELRQEINSLNSQIEYKQSQKERLDEQVKELEIIESGREPQYVVTFRIKQGTFTLDIFEHIKNEINAIDMDIPVTKEFYDAVKINQDISNEFKFGSLIMDGDFSKLHVKVADKKIM